MAWYNPFSWKTRKAIQDKSKGLNSLFSSDIRGDDLTPQVWEECLRRSFQRLPGEFKKVDRAGKETTKALVKAPTAIGQYAMDAPSEGNPLSMSPFNPIANIFPRAQVAWYASQGFIGYQLCAIFMQHWLIYKLCFMPAQDAVRNGYELATDDDDKIDPKVLSLIRKLDRAYHVKEECVDFTGFNRCFGIRIAMPIIETNDQNYYLKPFDISKVKPGSYKGISQIDPYWITPELDAEAAANPASLHFYEPTWWRINGQRVHRTHLIIIRNGKVPDILKPTYYYGGIPIPQKVAERVYAAERTANETPQLLMTKRTTWWKMDITQAVSNMQEFLQKVGFFARTRDNYGVNVGGLDDEMEQYDTGLEGMDDVTMMQYTIACAAADCDAAKVMCTSPKGGLGSEGGFNSDNYTQMLESIQESYMTPLVERHHQLLVASEIRPKFPNIPEGWIPTIDWTEVDVPTAKEQAEINKVDAETGNMLVNSGAIDGVDERNRLKGSKTSGYNGLAMREPEIPEEEGDMDGKAPGHGNGDE